MALVSLAPPSSTQFDEFVEAQIADYAWWLVNHGGFDSASAAQAHARSEIEGEMRAAAAVGDLFWVASAPNGRTVGWLWVRRTEPGLPVRAAFLAQIQVVSELRRQGFGREMLAALEVELARLGFREVRLNVWDSNVAARHLYAAAGFELAELLPQKRQLRKRLGPCAG